MAWAVGAALAAHGLDDELYWRERHLPLLVVATEVGYRFGEEGRVFWPRLEERLGAGFSETLRRERLILLFKRLSISPPPTGWATHRRLIAYPVTHAILPAWLHEPLLELIRASPWRIQPGGSYFEWLTENAARWPRLQILLHPSREAAARAVIEGILEVGTAEAVREQTLERFRRDVLAVPSTRAMLARAKARQPRLAPAPSPASAGRGAGLRRARPVVPLALSFEPLGLLLAPPLLPVREVPGADRIRICPLAEQRPISLRSLLRDGAILTRLPVSAGQLAPLLNGSWLEGVDGHLRVLLQGLQAHVKPPLLFSERGGPAGVALQVHGSFSATPGWWLLTQTQPPSIDGLSHKGMVAGLYCTSVDAAVASAAEWLAQQGFSLSQTPSLWLLGTAALDGPAGRTFSHEDVVAVEVAQGPVKLGPQSLSDGLYRISSDGAGKIEGAGGQVTMTFEAGAQRTRPPAVSLELTGPEISADALRERRLSLRLSGSAPISGLRAAVCLEVDGIAVAQAVTRPLPPLPCVVPAEDAIWPLLADATPAGRGIGLRVTIGGLGRARWWLDTAAAAVSWAEQQAESDEDIVGYQWLDSAGPITPITAAPEIGLKLPIFRSGRSRPGTGICIAPKRGALRASAPLAPDRITRDWAGIRPLLEALQLWQTARSEHLVAETHRRSVAEHLDRWSARALCGAVWLEAEARSSRARRSFGRVAAEALREAGVARDELAEHGWPPEKTDSFVSTLAALLEGAEPWLRYMLTAEVPKDALASMILSAYRVVGASDEPDPACEDELTKDSISRALRQWDEQQDMQPLLLRMVPQSERAGLAAIPYDEASFDDLVQAVTAWLRRASLVAPWPLEQVRALLDIWVCPAQASIEEHLFERALADQQGSRAVRYAALRRREAAT